MGNFSKADQRALKSLGSAIEKAIYEKFETKEKFLMEADISKMTLHQITTGQVDPQFLTLRRIAIGLGIPLRDILGTVE